MAKRVELSVNEQEVLGYFGPDTQMTSWTVHKRSDITTPNALALLWRLAGKHYLTAVPLGSGRYAFRLRKKNDK